MAKLLILTTGLRGIHHASLELAQRLRTAGHELVLSAPRDRYDDATQAGFRFIRLPMVDLNPCPAIPKKYVAAGRWKRWSYLINKRRERRQAALDATRPHAFTKLLEQEQPDLMLSDMELHDYIFMAYAQRVPCLLLSQWYTIWERPGLPYPAASIVPGEGFWGSRLGIWLHWRIVKWRRAWMFTKQRWLSLGCNRRSALLGLAKESGFPGRYLNRYLWPGPLTYNQLPVLDMAPVEVEFPHRPRPNLYYVGPMVHTERPEPEETDQRGRSLQQLAALAEERNWSVLVCSGSTLHQGDLAFLRKLISAVAERPEWLLMVGPLASKEVEQLGPLSERVSCFSFLPQLSALKMADLSINHGGIHTIHECLEFGLPMLVYSGKRSDQNGCAARVSYHGLGISADRDIDGSTEIGLNIQEVLSTPDYREAVLEMQQKISRYKDNQVLEEFVADALEGNIPLVRPWA